MNTRREAQQQRRVRILAAARDFVAEGGPDALTTRTVARAAGVSQPTLYHLIGSKAAILQVLQEETFARLEAALALPEGAGLARLEGALEALVACFAEDEAFYRAGFRANHALVQEGAVPGGLGDLDARMLQAAAQACTRLRREGLLRGALSAGFLAAQLYRGGRVPLDDWSRGIVDLPTCRRQALQGLYSALAPDATEAFAAVLRERLVALEAEGAAAPPLLEIVA